MPHPNDSSIFNNRLAKYHFSINAFKGPVNDPKKLICPLAAADEHCTFIIYQNANQQQK